jgi:hypothetical protein
MGVVEVPSRTIIQRVSDYFIYCARQYVIE